MRAPTPFFLHLQDILPFYAVPKQAIDSARQRGVESSWTRPEHIVTSGPFALREWRPYEAIRLRKNQFHYESDLVVLEEIDLLPTASATAIINLYKAGESDSMLGRLVAPVFLPLLRSKKDFQTLPAFWCMFYVVNTSLPPFDNVLVRMTWYTRTPLKRINTFAPMSMELKLLSFDVEYFEYEVPEICLNRSIKSTPTINT